MAYAEGNPPTKKALKEAVAAGMEIGIFSPGPFPVNQNGRVSVEGPHYPQPHRWHATCEVKDGIIVKVLVMPEDRTPTLHPDYSYTIIFAYIYAMEPTPVYVEYRNSAQGELIFAILRDNDGGAGWSVVAPNDMNIDSVKMHLALNRNQGHWLEKQGVTIP